MKKKCSSINDFSYVGRRLLKKDLADQLGISTSTLYRYSKGYRIPSKSLESKIKKIRFIVPKKISSKIKVKRKRLKKIESIQEQDFYKIAERTTTISNKKEFLYTGNYKNIDIFIREISEQEKDGDNVTYQIVRERYVNNEKFLDSTFGLHIDSLDTLIAGFKKLLAKYQSLLRTGMSDEDLTENIIILRTEYF